ncbi:MAG: hypothetical protein IT320_19090 [Anaerolineae bacterium]|nr:hypothetical protein [Anaerolineae bacterium]
MNDLIQRLDELLAPINERMASFDRQQLIRYVAIYMLVAGIFSFCGGIALFTAGVLGGIGGAVGSVALQSAGEVTSEQQQQLDEAARALSEVGAYSGLAVIWAIMSLVAAPLLILAAIGLFQRKSWGRNAAVIAFLVNAISSLIGLVTGGGIFNIIWVLISAYLAYYFYSNEPLKAEFS